MKTKTIHQNIFFITIAAVVLISLVLRLFTSLPNFAPFGALALFSGAYISNKKYALAMPLAGLFISDLILELNKPGAGFYPELFFVYAAYAVTIVLGFSLNTRRNIFKIGGFSLAASLLFFAISNFGVWMMQDIYPKTFTGILSCYTAAVPFIKNTFVSDVAFSALFFGAAYLYQSRLSLRSAAKA